MIRLKGVIVICFILFLNSSLIAQVKSIGTPFVQNFNLSTYLSGSQTWSIEQGNNGMMYFANNNGLLEYDGNNWNVYGLPNKSILRSIAKGSDDKLFAGGFNELGYYQLGEMGGAVYKSLIDLVPKENLDFGEVWRIFIHNDGIIFQTFNQVMLYKNDTIKVIQSPSSYHFSFLVNNEYYINDMEKGLMRYAMGNFYPLIGLEKLKGKEIWGILSLNNQLLIATASDGLYLYNGNTLSLWETESSRFLLKNQIYSTLRLSDNLIAFGTIQNGLLICDNSGKPLQHIHMEDGIQNNTILSMRDDIYGNLWLGTDHGIDYIEINSPLSQLSHNYGLSTGYAAIVFKDNLYLGTNQGLFVKKMSEITEGGIEPKKMKLIENTSGQVWSLCEIDGNLFCGHNNGTFLLNGLSAEKITDVPGGWSFLKIPDDSSKIIGGTYLGFLLYQKQNGKWKYSKPIKGFSESSRTIAFDNDGSLWMAHGYKGVFHLFFNKEYDSVIKVDFYNDSNSELSAQDVSLAKIDDKIIFTSLQSIYTYSPSQNNFIPYENLNKLLNGKLIRSIKEDKNGNIWYFSDNESGVLRLLEDYNYSDINLPFRQLEGKFVRGFEFVYPLDEKNVFYGSENGFIHYNPSANKNYTYSFRTYLKSLRSYYPDSVILLPINGENSIVLENSNNNIEFLFSANDFENPEKIMFSTYLEGYDQGWSNWQLRNSSNYTNMYEGNYKFRVRAKNIYGTITEEESISFSILPPFRRSLLAYILYGFVFLLFLLFLSFLQRKRLERAKIKSQKEQEEIFRKKEEDFQRKASEAEKKFVKMQNEKLKEDNKLKDKELANSTMQTLQKNKMLTTLRDELKKLAGHSKDEGHKYEVNRLVRKINKEIEDENQWNIFETHFESVHEEFLKRFKTAFPDLTPSELKLCAYLRMNISSKEISLLMNISTRGVEISRYRLRKKLNLSRETNLTDFILSF